MIVFDCPPREFDMTTITTCEGHRLRRCAAALCASGLVCGCGMACAGTERMAERTTEPAPLASQDLPEADSVPGLLQLNQFFNHRIVNADDLQTWGRADHWATPAEVLARGRGDCEDYAIAKYFALLAAGVPPRRLHLLYARVLLGGAGDLWRPHMVLVYLDDEANGGDPLVLDSLIDEVRPLSRRPDLRALFSFGVDGLWRGVDGHHIGRAEQLLSAWRGVLQRMAATTQP